MVLTELQVVKTELAQAKRELDEARAVLAVLFSWSPSYVTRATYQAGMNAAGAGQLFDPNGKLDLKPGPDLPTIS